MYNGPDLNMDEGIILQISLGTRASIHLCPAGLDVEYHNLDM